MSCEFLHKIGKDGSTKYGILYLVVRPGGLCVSGICIFISLYNNAKLHYKTRTVNKIIRGLWVIKLLI